MKTIEQKAKNVPAIRFAGFDDEWKKLSFADVGNVCMCKRVFKEETSDKGDIPFYKIGTFGGIPDAYITKELYNEYRTKFSYPEKGDILLSAAGTIGRIVEYDGECAYFQDSNIVWLSHDKSITNKFLKVLYPTLKWGGIEGSTIQRLYNDIFLKTSFFKPTISEQQKIGSFFSNIDSLISLEQKKYDKLTQVKKSMLEKMFPKEGATVPEIRFAGFTGDWNVQKASKICSITTGKSNTQDQVDGGLYPFFIRSDEPVRSNRYLYDEEAVITIGDGNIGKVFHYVNGKFDLHQRCYKMSDFKDVLGKYFYYFFSTKFYHRAIKMTAKATVDSVRLEMISEMDIQYPENLNEQQKIGSYFSHLDSLVSLQQRKLEKLKNIKKSLLEKMFV